MDWCVQMQTFRSGHVFQTASASVYFRKWAWAEQGRRLKENVNTGLVALHIEIRKSKILGITKKRTTTTKVSLMPSNIKVSYPTLCKNFGVEILIPSTSGHGLFGNRWLYSYKYNKTQ